MWKTIPGTNGAYSANSETGQIRGNPRLGLDGRKLKEVILKPWVQNSGYKVVSLRLNGVTKDFLVHRLMGKTYLSNFRDDLEINHINGIKTDNRLINLECVTRSENILHAYRNGLTHFSEKQKENAKRAGRLLRERYGKSIAKCDLVSGEILEVFEVVSDAYKKYGYHISALSRVANGKQKSSYGYTWKWIEKCND